MTIIIISILIVITIFLVKAEFDIKSYKKDLVRLNKITSGIIVKEDIQNEVIPIIQFCKSHKGTFSDYEKAELIQLWSSLCCVLNSGFETLISSSFKSLDLDNESISQVEHKQYFIESLDNMFDSIGRLRKDKFICACYHLYFILIK